MPRIWSACPRDDLVNPYVQVGFDVPHVTNDMILRFMDVDFSLLPGLTAGTKSRVGDDERVSVGLAGAAMVTGMPLLKGGTTDWEGESTLIVCCQ